MADKAMIDVTESYERMKAQLLLIRVVLGISPIQDVVLAVQTLHEQGKDEFENLRGPRSDEAAKWLPR